jgi:hypothetical protein
MLPPLHRGLPLTRRPASRPSLRGTAENAAYYAQESFSDPSAAQDMARAAWEAGGRQQEEWPACEPPRLTSGRQ